MKKKEQENIFDTSSHKTIPVARAKELAQQYGYDELIIVGAHYKSGEQCVCTYGKSQAACENAALGGNAIKRLLKWPEELCNAKPARQKRKEVKKWTDDDMIRYASKCYYSKDETIAYSDLLTEYKKQTNEINNM